MGKRILNAYDELMEELEGGEIVDGIVFGNYGNSGYGEPEPNPVPEELKGKLLKPEEAKPYMDGWSFYSDVGAVECYATYIWTNKRVMWITQYDGATNLDSMPRNPCDIISAYP